MYSLTAYGAMIADRVRTGAYVEALARTVHAGTVVLDLGTGPGFFALVACRLGASRVYAIEPNDAIHVGRELAAANGYSDRIHFIQGLSTAVALPEPVDVMVSDLRGGLPLSGCHIPDIIDARRRLLIPGGVQIPQSDTLWSAVVEAPDAYTSQRGPLDGDCYGLDLQPLGRYLTNSCSAGRVGPEQLLSGPERCATLDYRTIETPHVSSSLVFTIVRKGIGHGLHVWFDTSLIEGTGFSSAPGRPDLVYGNMFLPWERPVALDVGDHVGITLHATLVEKDYVWSWDTRVSSLASPASVKAEFRQSTFFAGILSPDRLRKRAAGHAPILNHASRIDCFILALMDGEHPLDEIASRLMDRFPTDFTSRQDALAHVGSLSERCAR